MYLFLDTETHAEVEPLLIQLAYKPSDKLEYFTSLYSTWGIPITLSSMAIHHITENELVGKERFIDSAERSTLQKLLESYTLVAHNARFDVDVLERSGVDVSLPICTLRLSRYLLPEIEQHKLQYLRYYLGVEFSEKPQIHDALWDVLVLEKVFEKLYHLLKEKAPEKNEQELRNMMIEISSHPSILHLCRFGKYKGVLWSEVPHEYLDWIVHKSDFTDEDVLYTARHYLEG